MTALLVIVLIVAAASLALNAAYIVHELGWFPHTKNRRSPTERTFPYRSLHDTDRLATHDFQVMDAFSAVARQHGHADVYGIQDPYRALENVISRYRQQPSRSRYDDLVHVSNYICNSVRCDERVNTLIDEIHELMHSQRPEVA